MVIIRTKEIVSSPTNATALPYAPGAVTAYRTASCSSAPRSTNVAIATPNCAQELGNDVKQRIPQRNVSQPIEREGYSRIEMTSGLFTHGVRIIAITVAPIDNP
jgi:hypothetical protein